LSQLGIRVGGSSGIADDAGDKEVPHTQGGGDWHMKIDDARCKLASIYPIIQLWQNTRDEEVLAQRVGQRQRQDQDDC
jgi:hypothetical protein